MRFGLLLAEAGLGPNGFYSDERGKALHLGAPRQAPHPLRHRRNATLRPVPHGSTAEIAAVRPKVIVALGATALAALTRKRMGIAATRGLDVRHGDAHLVADLSPFRCSCAPRRGPQGGAA